MKKFTFLMSLLLAFGTTTTSAQVLKRSGWKVTTSGECDDSSTGHAASIIDGNNNTYWHSNWGGYNASGDGTQTLPQFFQLDLGTTQEFNKIGYMPRQGLGNGTVLSYKIYVSGAPFESVSSNKSAKAIVDALGSASMEGEFTYGTTAELKTAKSSTTLSGRYVLFVVTNAKSDQAAKNKYFASCAEFYLSKDADFTEQTATVHYLVNGEEYATKSITYIDKSTATIGSASFLSNGAVTETTDGFNVACTVKTLPFVAQTSFDATNAHWYAMTLRGKENNYLLTDGGGESVSTTAVSTTNHPDVLEDAYQWAFVGNLKDGFKLYSKKQNKPVTLSGHLKLIDGEGTTFKLKELASGDGFGMFETEAAGCINQDKSANNVAPWSGFDDGSTLRLQEPKIYVTNFAAPFEGYDDSQAPAGAIGTNGYMSVAANKTTFDAAYTAAKAATATAEQIKALAEINKQIATQAGETVQAGKYYRLYNVSDSRKWLTVKSDDNSILNCSADAEKGIGSVVTFESISAEPGQYRMKFEGKTLGKYKADNNAIKLVDDNSDEKGSYTVNHAGTKFTFYDKASNKAHSYIHCNTNDLVGWEVSAPSKWYVVPATDAEVTMNTVDGKSYATAYLPFGVSAVSGAEAYVGTLNTEKNALDMTQVNAVPANKGFVLVGTGDKATLTIGEANELTVDNALVGTNAKITVNDANRANYLVFGKNKANTTEVGFFKPSTAVTAIPANKAFLNASALTQEAIAMNFGDNTTGVNTVVLGENGVNAPVFDLSGRRVVAPVKGGVYIQNGKKFIK